MFCIAAVLFIHECQINFWGYNNLFWVLEDWMNLFRVVLTRIKAMSQCYTYPREYWHFNLRTCYHYCIFKTVTYVHVSCSHNTITPTKSNSNHRTWLVVLLFVSVVSHINIHLISTSFCPQFYHWIHCCCCFLLTSLKLFYSPIVFLQIYINTYNSTQSLINKRVKGSSHKL